jgi:hypothetical protein
VTAPAPTVADEFPIRNVRFVGGRTWHRVRPPRDQRWWDLLEAACGRPGTSHADTPTGPYATAEDARKP